MTDGSDVESTLSTLHDENSNRDLTQEEIMHVEFDEEHWSLSNLEETYSNQIHILSTDPDNSINDNTNENNENNENNNDINSDNHNQIIQNTNINKKRKRNIISEEKKKIWDAKKKTSVVIQNIINILKITRSKKSKIILLIVVRSM